MMKKAIFPGTFDPFTIGHYDIVQRGLEIFDEIIIGIGINGSKKTMFDLQKRINIIERVFVSEKRVKILTYQSLTVDFAEKMNAKFILRGVRSHSDFEYENNIAIANKKIKGIETVLLFSKVEYSFVSSSFVRELLLFNKSVKSFLAPNTFLN